MSILLGKGIAPKGMIRPPLDMNGLLTNSSKDRPFNSIDLGVRGFIVKGCGS